MSTFGYTAGMGTGANVQVILDKVLFSRYENTTGAWVFVHLIDILNVAVAVFGDYQVAIYTDAAEPGQVPSVQLGVSAVVSGLGVGSTTFTLPQVFGVAPGGFAWVGLLSLTDNIVRFDGVTLIGGGRHSQARAFPADYHEAYRVKDWILPATLTGSTLIDPTGTDLRVPLAGAEPLIEGFSVLRAALAGAEPLTEGASVLRCAFSGLEALIQVPEVREMATDVFPLQLGTSWETKKTPNFNTQVRTATSLRATRNSLTPFPAWDFELSFPYLPADAPFMSGSATPDLAVIQGFFLKMRGRARPFLFRDPFDNTALNVAMIRTTDLGSGGDGVTTEFYFAHDIGGFVEPVGQVDTVAGYIVYVGGVAQAAGVDFDFVAPNKAVFTAAPADLALVTSTHQFDFVCNFLDDAAAFEQFNRDLFALNEVRFRADPP